MKDKQFVVTEDLEIYDTLDSWRDYMIIDDDNCLVEYLNDGEDGVSNYGKVLFTADTYEDCKNFITFFSEWKEKLVYEMQEDPMSSISDEAADKLKEKFNKELNKEIIDMLDETIDKVFIDSDKTKEEKWQTILNLASNKIKNEDKDFTEFNNWCREKLLKNIASNNQPRIIHEEIGPELSKEEAKEYLVKIKKQIEEKANFQMDSNNLDSLLNLDTSKIESKYVPEIESTSDRKLSLEEKAKLFDAIERNIGEVNMSTGPEKLSLKFEVSINKLLSTDEYKILENGEDFDLISKWLINKNK